VSLRRPLGRGVQIQELSRLGAEAQGRAGSGQGGRDASRYSCLPLPGLTPVNRATRSENSWACQEQPALFHFQIMLNCRCIYGGSCPPSALLGTAKTLARWIAQFNQHGCPPRGLITGSAVSSITFAASPARAAIISRIWRAASICSSIGGRELWFSYRPHQLRPRAPPRCPTRRRDRSWCLGL
jgi:hypothetical protein